MLVLGIILVVVSVLFLVAALTGGSNEPASFDLGIFDVETSTLGIFLIGAVTVLLFAMGLELIRSGLRRTARQRRDKKDLNRLTKEQETRSHPSSQSGPE